MKDWAYFIAVRNKYRSYKKNKAAISVFLKKKGEKKEVCYTEVQLSDNDLFSLLFSCML